MKQKKLRLEMVLVCDNAVVHSLEGNGDIAFFQCLTWNTENFFSSDRINKKNITLFFLFLCGQVHDIAEK